MSEEVKVDLVFCIIGLKVYYFLVIIAFFVW